MRDRREFIGASIGGLFILASCNREQPLVRLSFRVIIEVETPKAIRRSSSVWEVAAREVVKVGDSSSVQTTLRAEAIPILLDRRYLFVLVDEQLDRWMFQSFITYSGEKDYTTQTISRLSSPQWQGRYSEIARKHYPRMVAFSDTRDPSTIKLVDPNNIAPFFGKGFSVLRLGVQISNTKITTGIEKTLPWLTTDYEKNLSPDFQPHGIPLGNFQRLFSTELKR